MLAGLTLVSAWDGSEISRPSDLGKGKWFFDLLASKSRNGAECSRTPIPLHPDSEPLSSTDHDSRNDKNAGQEAAVIPRGSMYRKGAGQRSRLHQTFARPARHGSKVVLRLMTLTGGAYGKAWHHGSTHRRAGNLERCFASLHSTLLRPLGVPVVIRIDEPSYVDRDR